MDKSTHSPGPLQRALATVAIVATLPYLVLKAMWLSGSQVGLNDPEFGRSTAMVVANTLTAGMDLVALLIAAVFLTRRGMRAPAAPILLPMWIGSGLLGQILVSLPLLAVSPAQTTDERPGVIADWVFAMVYGGFGVLGIGLLGAFALYARRRWSTHLAVPVTAAARRRLVVAAGLLVVAGLTQLALAAGLSTGARVLELTLALAAAAALLAMGLGRGARRVPSWAVVVAWVGTGAMTAWSLYYLVLDLVPNDLLPTPGIDVPTSVAAAVRVIAGVVGVLALVGRLAGPTSPGSVAPGSVVPGSLAPDSVAPDSVAPVPDISAAHSPATVSTAAVSPDVQIRS